MSEASAAARRLLERTGEHPVVSLFLDLDPEEFATAPARATQLRSLLDDADRVSRDDATLDHDDRRAVTEDLRRLDAFLSADDAPFSGARALAVFSSGRDDLFEAVKLVRPAQSRVVIARTPYVEPLVAGEQDERWCVTLVSRRVGRIFAGEASHIRERAHTDGDVHGRHSQGGWSQPRYERSYENEADEHLRELAGELYRLWQREPFDRLFIGGPDEILNRFVGFLHNDLRPTLQNVRIAADVALATPTDVQSAMRAVLEQDRASAAGATVEELDARLRAEANAALGLGDTLDALAQRRVRTLVLERNFTAAGGRCPSCGMLVAADTTSCPADDTPIEPSADLREAAVEAAVLQDAGVVVVGEGYEIPPPILVRGGGIGALLRF